ncbi:MAG: fused MFS/spermidine synthase [Candidatus Obscuribacterales bacterium]|nr:fused MFS/spermidine synthase [Candidatus Obscuribacterales bacterium]
MSTKNIAVIGFSAIVLSGAFLLFTLEPLVGKLVTPAFGGTAGVWSACMLFFQVALLSGYFAAYSISRLAMSRQVIIYGALLIVSTFFSRPPGLTAWFCNDINNPALDLMGALTQRLALPFIVLSTISIMMQTWYRRMKLGDPYPLYSVSNIGSMVALLAYPILIEPAIALENTTQLWSYCYIGLVALALAMCAAMMNMQKRGLLIADNTTEAEGSTSAPKPTLRDGLLWCYLSAAGSITLLAFTTYITQDVTPMPLFWVLPLAAYLLTFILLFVNPKVYFRRAYIFISMTLWLSELFVFAQASATPSRDSLALLFAVNLALMFFMCMVFHGELVARRPHPIYLPTFYVAMAFGGAVGGIFVNFIAPLIFSFYAERQLAVVLLVVVAAGLVVTKRFRKEGNLEGVSTLSRLSSKLLEVMVLVMALLSLSLCAVPFFFLRSSVIAEQRNFYSSIQITSRKPENGPNEIAMVHGRVIHGLELKNVPPEKANGLYWKNVSIAFQLAREMKTRTSVSATLKVGIVGLGVGGNAAFAKDGDSIKYYELDPKVEYLARKYFSFIKSSKANVEVLIGDGRSVLNREPSQAFDLLFIDVFNGDSIPVHLINKQAMEIYLRHLKPDGVLVFHVSNRFLKLPPVIGNLAKEFSLNAVTSTVQGSTHVFLTRDPALLDTVKHIYEAGKADYGQAIITKTEPDPNQRLWTDDYVNLLPLLNTEAPNLK